MTGSEFLRSQDAKWWAKATQAKKKIARNECTVLIGVNHLTGNSWGKMRLTCSSCGQTCESASAQHLGICQGIRIPLHRGPTELQLTLVMNKLWSLSLNVRKGKHFTGRRMMRQIASKAPPTSNRVQLYCSKMSLLNKLASVYSLRMVMCFSNQSLRTGGSMCVSIHIYSYMHICSRESVNLNIISTTFVRLPFWLNN